MLAIFVTALLVILGPTPQKPSPTTRAPQKQPAAKVCPRQPDKQLCERGWQMLEYAEAEAGGLNDSGMRAYALLQIARGYALTDKARATGLLDQAFQASFTMPDYAPGKSSLQSEILVNLAPLAPQRTDELLPQAGRVARKPAMEALLSHFEQAKQYAAALEMIARLARVGGFPYAATSSMMDSLPEDKAAERLQLFGAALASFRTEPPPDRYAMFFGRSDFGDMLVSQWRKLPPVLVREAIDELLKQADVRSDPNAPPVRFMNFGSAGAVAFSSWYEYRLFQLLPVLRQIDEAAANELLKKNEVTARELKKHPEGTRTRVVQGTPTGAGVVATNVGGGISVSGNAATNPEDVLTKCMAVPDAGSRAVFLVEFARAAAKINPDGTRMLLAKVLDPVAADLKPDVAVSSMTDSAELYRQLEDKNDAIRAIELGVKAADKLYEDDTDSANPNRYLKAFWPFTNAWVRFVRLAARVSPDLALAIVKDVRDDEIRPLLSISLASAWLGAPLGPVTVIKKNGSWLQKDDPEEPRP